MPPKTVNKNAQTKSLSKTPSKISTKQVYDKIENIDYDKKTLTFALSITKDIVLELLLLPNDVTAKEFKTHLEKKYKASQKSKDLFDMYVYQEARFKELIKKIRKHVPDEASQRNIKASIQYIFEKVKDILFNENPIIALKKWFGRNKEQGKQKGGGKTATTTNNKINNKENGEPKKDLSEGAALTAILVILGPFGILIILISIVLAIADVFGHISREFHKEENMRKEKQRKREQMKKEIKDELLKERQNSSRKKHEQKQDEPHKSF